MTASSRSTPGPNRSTPAPSQRVPPRGALSALFSPAAWAYRLAVNARNRRFDAGINVSRVPIPVISVGNLSLGGTGKTPTCAFLLQFLLDSNHHPCLAMRGYSRSPAQRGLASDEARFYLRSFPSVPVVAQPDRTAGIRALLADASLPPPRPDCVVLDDAFQHRRLARDLDIVLIDASEPLGAQACLPAGRLREPVESLSRAHIVVFTHAEIAAPDTLAANRALVRTASPRAVQCVSRHAWTGYLDAEDRPIALSEPGLCAHHFGGAAGAASQPGAPPEVGAATSAVMGLCAIGRPEAFRAQLFHALSAPRATRPDRDPDALPFIFALPDHDPYAPSTIERVIREARRRRVRTIVTTEKDWSKLAPFAGRFARESLVLLRAQLALRFDEGEQDLRARVLRAVDASSPGAPSDAGPAPEVRPTALI